MSRSSMPFVPRDFAVPERLDTAEFRLRMLTVRDVVQDYDAVSSSTAHLRTSGRMAGGLTASRLNRT